MKKILKGFIFGLVMALIYLLYYWITLPIILSNKLDYRVSELFFIPTFPGSFLSLIMGLGQSGILMPMADKGTVVAVNFIIYLILFWCLWIVFTKTKNK